MDENILYIIVFTVLIYLFEHKILPTLITAGLSIWRITTILSETITQTDSIIIFMYVIVFFYAAYMIFISPVVHEENIQTGDL